MEKPLTIGEKRNGMVNYIVRDKDCKRSESDRHRVLRDTVKTFDLTLMPV